MATETKPSKALKIFTWIMQGVLATFMIMGAIMKFMPIEKISAMMPWTGEIPSVLVRLLGVVDLLGALGLILPSLFRMKLFLINWAAIGVLLLMVSAITFHISRGEQQVIGFNIFLAALAVVVLWLRRKHGHGGRQW